MRPAPRGQERLREAAKLGFSVTCRRAAGQPAAQERQELSGLTLHGVDRIEDCHEPGAGLLRGAGGGRCDNRGARRYQKLLFPAVTLGVLLLGTTTDSAGPAWRSPVAACSYSCCRISR